MKYLVATVTSNLEEYPECKEDTEKYSHLVDYIEDEIETFVINEEGEFWPATEFFLMEDIKEFFSV